MQHISELVAEPGELTPGCTITAVFSWALAQGQVGAPVQHQPGGEPFHEQVLIESEHLHCLLIDAAELSQSWGSGVFRTMMSLK